MYGWDHDEEPAGESHRRLPPRRRHPRDDFDDGPDYGRRHPRDDFDDGADYDYGRSRPRDDFDGRRDFGTGHPREDPSGGHDYSRSQPRVPSNYDHYFEHPAAGPGMGSRRRPASDHLRSAGRRVGHALGWFGVLVLAPLIVGILAGAVGQHIGL